MARKKLTIQDFIFKSKIIHGNTYDYSETDYIGALKDVKIICRIHGAFFQRPDCHYNGSGCPVCGRIAGNNLLCSSNEEFLKKAYKVHGLLWDYSETFYINSITPIKIICKIHGEFLQTPSVHLMGSSCKKCSINAITLTKKEFVSKSVKKHGSKYDYSLVDYFNNNTKIKIICNESNHGIFQQVPSTHLKGIGCPKCSKKAKLSTEEYIVRSVKTHGSKYSYENTVYVNSHIKVKINCNTHGTFEQKPHDHLMGHGCQSCKQFANENLTGVFLREIIGDKIKVERHKRFRAIDSDVRKNIFVDYYFELAGNKYIVEYNGNQHYERHWSAKDDVKLIEQQKRDVFLKKMCVADNIALIEIDGRNYKGNEIKKIFRTYFIQFLISLYSLKTIPHLIPLQ